MGLSQEGALGGELRLSHQVKRALNAPACDQTNSLLGFCCATRTDSAAVQFQDLVTDPLYLL